VKRIRTRCLWISKYCYSALCITLSPNTIQHLALNDVTPEILTPFLSLLRKGTIRFPNVTSLYWQIYLNDKKDVLDIIPAFPAVESLTIMEDSDKFLEVLSQKTATQQQPVWPHLCVLHFRNVKLNLLRDFVSYRQMSGYPIKEVRCATYSQTTEAMDWLREKVQLDFDTYGVLTEQGTRWKND
jgi:hypothetical protein